MITSANVRGFILAGGASRRFGRDKALVEFRGEPLIARICRILQSATAQPVRIIGDVEKYKHIGVESIADRWPGEGPLGGIITALEASDTATHQPSWSLILGCDMPFLASDWLQHLASRAAASGADVVVAESSNGLEPLCACWRRSGVPVLKQAFESGTRRIADAMKQLPMEVLDAADWKRFDKFDNLFWNMNTPSDYEKAVGMLKLERS